MALLVVLTAAMVLAGCLQTDPVHRGCYGGFKDVDIVDFAFEPGDACIHPETTVIWTNEGSKIHTVTAVNGTFDSGDIAPGETFELALNQTGTVQYHCRYHSTVGDDGSRSGMVGVLRVEER